MTLSQPNSTITTKERDSPRNRKRVVILGGGFAGLKAAQALSKNLSSETRKSGSVEVLLINKTNYHLFTPMLYQMSTGKVDLDSIAPPIRRVARKNDFDFLEAEIRSINIQAQFVYADNYSIPYDYLVIALGNMKDDRKIEGASKYAIPLKTLHDGGRIHDRIIESLEKAENISDKNEREAYLNFVVIGGSTGAELAGAIVDYLDSIKRYYPKIDARRECNVYVIEKGERLFPDREKSLSDIVRSSLESRGVHLVLKTRVERIDHDKITLASGETIRSWNVFDNSGVMPNPVVERIPETEVKKIMGRIVVDRFLRIPDFTNVFAIGDNAAVEIDKTSEGRPQHAPPTAESAVEEGEYVGKLLANVLNHTPRNQGRAESDRSRLVPKLSPFRYKEKATMLSIGAHNGVAKFSHMTLTGLLGWLAWRIIHLYLVTTSRAKLLVLFDWIMDLFGEFNATQIARPPNS